MKLTKYYRTMRDPGLIALVMILPVLCGCEPKPPPIVTQSESQALEDEEWIRGAKRPPTPRTLLALSRVLISQGRREEAQSVLYRITRQHPYYPEAYVELAEIHMRRRRVDTAIKTLSEGLASLPNDHVLVNNLGMCYLIRRDYPKAEEKFRAAAWIAPNNTRYRSNVALVLGLQGRYDEALALYKQVTTDIEAHFNLAVICDARNDSDRAKQEREKVKMYKALAAKAAAEKAAAIKAAQAASK